MRHLSMADFGEWKCIKMKWILKKFQMEDCNNVDTPFRNLYENTVLALLVGLTVVSFVAVTQLILVSLL